MEWIYLEGANHMGSFETSKTSIYIKDEMKEAQKLSLRFLIIVPGCALIPINMSQRLASWKLDTVSCLHEWEHITIATFRITKHNIS